MLYRLRCELDRLSDRAATGARHQARRVDSARDQLIEEHRALFGRQRVRLAGGAEHREPAVLRKQPLAMREETFLIRREIGSERSDNRRQDAADVLGHDFLRKRWMRGNLLLSGVLNP